MKTGIELIGEERGRQISQEGWTPEHDDTHTDLELASAASAYLMSAVGRRPKANKLWPREWPNGGYEIDHEKSQIRKLEIAGALIAAEIDRLQRKAEGLK